MDERERANKYQHDYNSGRSGGIGSGAGWEAGRRQFDRMWSTPAYQPWQPPSTPSRDPIYREGPLGTAGASSASSNHWGHGKHSKLTLLLLLAAAALVVWPWLFKLGITGWLLGRIGSMNINADYVPIVAFVVQAGGLFILCRWMSEKFRVISFLCAAAMLYIYFNP